MPNANKRKGDRFERSAVLTAQEYFPDAWRTRAGWDDDRGDVILVKDYSLIQQAKDCQARPWFSWLAELDAQKRNAGARWGCVVSKRPGFPDAADAMAIMRNRDWLALVQHVHVLESALMRYRSGQPVPVGWLKPETGGCTCTECRGG